MTARSIHAPSPGRSRPARTWLPVLAICLVALLLVWVLSAVSGVPFRNDFAAYWPVGRLLLDGQNPYDAGAIEVLQHSVGDLLGGDSIVRYPPWSLPLLLPFAALPYVPGWYLWMLLQAVLIGVSAVWLWQMFGGGFRAGIPLAVAFGFPAGLFVALGGQIGGMLLFGVTVFLWAILERRDILAGFCLGLLTLKPHLFLPLGIVVLLWSARDRRWRVPTAAVVTILAGSGLALAFRSTVFSDYLQLLESPGTSWQRAVALGTAASTALGGRASWLQWTPAALVTVFVIGAWARFAGRFDWRRDLPLILVLGLISAPYLLVHDLVLLIPAWLTMALCVVAWESAVWRWIAVLGFTAFSVVVWIGQIAEHTVVVHVWVTPLVLILAIAAAACLARKSGVAVGHARRR